MNQLRPLCDVFIMSNAAGMLPSTESSSCVNQAPSLLKPMAIIACTAALMRSSVKWMTVMNIIEPHRV